MTVTALTSLGHSDASPLSSRQAVAATRRFSCRDGRGRRVAVDELFRPWAWSRWGCWGRDCPASSTAPSRAPPPDGLPSRPRKDPVGTPAVRERESPNRIKSGKIEGSRPNDMLCNILGRNIKKMKARKDALGRYPTKYKT